MTKQKLVDFLKENRPAVLEKLFSDADEIRKEYVGDAVHLRGIIEFSNYCRQNCLYCGLRESNAHLERYRMDYAEILETATRAKALRIPTVVLQSGEDPWYTTAGLCRLVEKIKKLGLSVTLCIGERPYRDFRQLRNAGTDRYLLKFETSDQKLYRRLKPQNTLAARLRCLDWLKKLKYETGSGIMVGLPGQTNKSIAEDILLFKRLKLDMIGIGPFIPHPHTPLAGSPAGTLEAVLKAVALARILTRDTNIPATTAAGTIDSEGRQKALACGANVLMPNITPVRYRKLYQIYPDKICITEDAGHCRGCVEGLICAAGRTIACGSGNRVRR